MKDIILLLAGFLLGFAQIFILNIFKRCRIRYANKKSNQDTIQYDPEKDGLLLLHSWSYEHRLLPQNMKIELRERPEQSFVDPHALETARQYFEKQNYKGDICYCVGYNVDHQDNIYGQMFVLEVAPCDYSEALALGEYLKDKPEKKQEIANIINKDPLQYFSSAIPSDIFVNLIVISENNNLLALRRSKSVASARGIWTIGAYETMEYRKGGTAKSDNNFHSLAERCLIEEFGIYRTFLAKSGKVTYYYNDIFISSFTLSLYHMGLLVFAVVQLKNMTEGEIEQRISRSHGKYESDQVRWLPFDKKGIKEFIENNTGIYKDFVDKEKGAWIDYAKFSLFEAIRVKDYNLFGE